ncbi:class I SAM-dependent methyltransferase [Pseudonocardia sichuanensis]|uniref:Methyltransferase family protein n=1 Tax=Pseudonocardia kunmingensis TaxID=630975 RepID=A0A543D9T3_9PSEU|nr:class I SAM-dependent methyltransferase [Pseudonocardia kunmingensis]TQM06066.1 methyltransferase family protein [Pseudonocardia kunmingensis]
MTGPSTDDPLAAEAVFAPVDAALTDPLPVSPGAAVADIGPGAGTVTLHLAERVGADGRVYAVDVDPDALAALRHRADAAGLGERLRTVRHDLDDGPPRLPEPVALVWSGACVHHALDQAASVVGLAGLLGPDGTLAVGEGGLPLRTLPWDVGVGRPGLEARLDAAHDSWFGGWFAARPGVVRETRGWSELLRCAGLHGVSSRSALLDLPAPLTTQARSVVLAELGARVRRARAFLDLDDAPAWDRLLDPDDADWLGHRPDLALLTARSVHTGRCRPSDPG